MKKLLLILMAALMSLSLTACGDGLSADEIAACEDYADMVADESDNTVEKMEVCVADKGGLLTDALSKAGSMQTVDLSAVKAVVIENGTDFYFMSDEGVIVSFQQSDITSAADSGSDALSVLNDAMTAFGIGDYASALDDDADLGDYLRQAAAKMSLAYDGFKAGNQAQYSAYQTVLAGYGDADLSENVEYYMQLNNNAYYHDFAAYDFYLSMIEAALAAWESGTNEDDSSQKVTDVIGEYEYENELRSLMAQKAGLQKTANGKAAGAQAFMEANAQAIADAKKTSSVEYFYDDAYLRLVLQNTAFSLYVDAVRDVAEIDYEIQLLKDLQEAETAEYASYMQTKAEVEKNYRQSYYEARLAYVKAQMTEENYKNANAAKISEYKNIAETIKSKYDDDSYEEDIDYIKNEMRFESLLNDLANYEEATKNAEAKINEITKEKDAELAEGEDYLKSAEESVKKQQDLEKLADYILGLKDGLENSEADISSESAVMGSTDGIYWVAMSEAVIEGINSTRSYDSESDYSGYDYDYDYDSDGDSSGYDLDDEAQAQYDYYDEYYSSHPPKEGESLSDYMKRVDPDLYNSIEENYYN